MKDVVLFDELKAPVASADASPVDDSADDDDDIDVDDSFLSMNGDRTPRDVIFSKNIVQTAQTLPKGKLNFNLQIYPTI